MDDKRINEENKKPLVENKKPLIEIKKILLVDKKIMEIRPIQKSYWDSDFWDIYKTRNDE